MKITIGYESNGNTHESARVCTVPSRVKYETSRPLNGVRDVREPADGSARRQKPATRRPPGRNIPSRPANIAHVQPWQVGQDHVGARFLPC